MIQLRSFSLQGEGGELNASRMRGTSRGSPHPARHEMAGHPLPSGEGTNSYSQRLCLQEANMRQLIRRRRNSFLPNARINITPLIDVLLVLIVIFMVITPVTPRGFHSDIPAPPPQQLQSKAERALVLSVNDDGSIRLNQESVDRGALPDRLSDIFRTRADRTIFIQADSDVIFDRVAQVIDVAQGSGADRIGLMTSTIALH
jgi:biopolymer transport protein TolR